MIIVGEDRAKGKGQRAKVKNVNEILFLNSKFAHSKLPSQKRFRH